MQATRRALRTATVELGLERGLDAVRVEEIAERAGVSTRTFFNYFAVKDDAALLDVLGVDDDGLATLTGPPDAVWARLRELFGADVERVGDGAGLARLMELHQRDPRLQSHQLGHFRRFEARLQATLAALLPDDPAGRLRAGVLSGSCITAVRVGLESWAREGRRGSPRRHVEDAFDVLAPAFTG